MKATKYYCDICLREVRSYNNIFRIKVRSGSFVDYCNFDSIGADKRTIDICDKCVARFKDFVRSEEKLSWWPEEVGK